MSKPTPKSTFDHMPRPNRKEWEQSINALRPWLTPEKFKETEAVHWRMFERADSWYVPGEQQRRVKNST